jgi:hypothetical protein
MGSPFAAPRITGGRPALTSKRLKKQILYCHHFWLFSPSFARKYPQAKRSAVLQASLSEGLCFLDGITFA